MLCFRRYLAHSSAILPEMKWGKIFVQAIRKHLLFCLLILTLIGLSYLWVKEPIGRLNLQHLPFALEIVDPDEATELEPVLVTPSHFIGAPTLLYFWASWCQSCEVEYPKIIRVAETAGTPERVLAIATFDDLKKVRASAKRKNQIISIAFDRNNVLANTLSLSVLPQSFLFDEGGELIRHFKGPIPKNEFEKLTHSLSLSKPLDVPGG